MATVVSRGSVEGGAWGGRVGVGLAPVLVVAAAAATTGLAEPATTTETKTAAASRPRVITTKKPASGLGTSLYQTLGEQEKEGVAVTATAATVEATDVASCPIGYERKKGYVSLLFLLLVSSLPFPFSRLSSYPHLPSPSRFLLLSPVPGHRYVGEVLYGNSRRTKSSLEVRTA